MKNELDEIYELYAADVYRYIYGLCRNEAASSDILQNTMMKAVMTADKFRGECSVRTWLYRIAKNELLNYIKRSDNRNLPLDEVPEQYSDDIEHRFSDRYTALQIHHILHGIAEPYREVFSLRVFAELKFSDISLIFGRSENWARVTFFRAKEKIIDKLREEEEQS